MSEAMSNDPVKDLALVIAKAPLSDIEVIQALMAAMYARSPDQYIKISFGPRQKGRVKMNTQLAMPSSPPLANELSPSTPFYAPRTTKGKRRKGAKRRRER